MLKPHYLMKNVYDDAAARKTDHVQRAQQSAVCKVAASCLLLYMHRSLARKLSSVHTRTSLSTVRFQLRPTAFAPRSSVIDVLPVCKGSSPLYTTIRKAATMPRPEGTESFKFNHTMLRVKDPKVSLKFYQEVVGEFSKMLSGLR